MSEKKLPGWRRDRNLSVNKRLDDHGQLESSGDNNAKKERGSFSKSRRKTDLLNEERRLSADLKEVWE